jgi:hypothetical protein
MARHVWTVQLNGSTSPESKTKRATAKPAHTEGDSGPRFGRLRSKGKKRESQAQASTTYPPPPDAVGMSAAPDNPRRPVDQLSQRHQSSNGFRFVLPLPGRRGRHSTRDENTPYRPV